MPYRYVLLICRQRSTSSIEEEDEDDEAQVGPHQAELGRSDSTRSSRSHRSDRSARSNRSHHSSRSARVGRDGDGDMENLQEVSLETDGSTHPSGSRTAPLDPSQPRRALSDFSRRGWGEAPTYLEAMSTPTYPDPTSPSLEAGLGIPPPRSQPSLRTRTSSGFRDLLNRAGMTFTPGSFKPAQLNRHEMTQTSRHSSTSLLLQPQSSRLSSATSYTARTSREHSREPSSSPLTSPWASTATLQISSPVPNSAVRASFVGSSIPKAGLSDDQMRFLSSSEAVNVAGVKMGDVPINKKRRKSVLGVEGGQAPPSWEEVNALEGRDEAGRTAEAGPSGSGSGSGVGDQSGLSASASSDQTHGALQEDRADVGPSQQPLQQRELSIATGAVPPPQPSATANNPSFEIEPPTPHSPTPTSGWVPQQAVIASPERAIVK